MTTADRGRVRRLARTTVERATAVLAVLAPFIVELDAPPYVTAVALGTLAALTLFSLPAQEERPSRTSPPSPLAEETEAREEPTTNSRTGIPA